MNDIPDVTARNRPRTAQARSGAILLAALATLSLLLTYLLTAPPAGLSTLGHTNPAHSHETRDERRVAHVVADADLNPATPTRSPAPVETPAQALDSPVQLVTLVPLTVDVWNADERYFAISGDTPERIIASAKANVPSDHTGADHESMAYAGPTVWEHEPSYIQDPATGSCTMTGVTSTTRYQATVPRWESPSSVPSELLAWWQVVLEHIRQHEGEHVHIFERFVGDLPARVAGQPCGSWGEIANTWSADVANAQAAFDAAEAGWAFPPYSGPLN